MFLRDSFEYFVVRQTSTGIHKLLLKFMISESSYSER